MSKTGNAAVLEARAWEMFVLIVSDSDLRALVLKPYEHTDVEEPSDLFAEAAFAMARAFERMSNRQP